MSARVSTFADAYLIDGARTPFVGCGGAFALVSPIDLGIKAARAAIAKVGADPADIGMVMIAGSSESRESCFARGIAAYAGVPGELLVRGSGLEALAQAADGSSLSRTGLALAVGSESPSSSLVRGGADCASEALARTYGITREAVDAFASRSSARAMAGLHFIAGEVVEVVSETLAAARLESRSITLPPGVKSVATDSHIRRTPLEALARVEPLRGGGLETEGNSSQPADGAGAILVGSRSYMGRTGKRPLARMHLAATDTGSAPAISAVLAAAGLTMDRIDRIEIDEVSGVQVLACVRELRIDEQKLNVNGGAIAIGHPRGATGIRQALTLARELRRSHTRWGIASETNGGEQGIALLIENEEYA